MFDFRLPPTGRTQLGGLRVGVFGGATLVLATRSIACFGSVASANYRAARFTFSNTFGKSQHRWQLVFEPPANPTNVQILNAQGRTHGVAFDLAHSKTFSLGGQWSQVAENGEGYGRAKAQ